MKLRGPKVGTKCPLSPVWPHPRRAAPAQVVRTWSGQCALQPWPRRRCSPGVGLRTERSSKPAASGGVSDPSAASGAPMSTSHWGRCMTRVCPRFAGSVTFANAPRPRARWMVRAELVDHYSHHFGEPIAPIATLRTVSPCGTSTVPTVDFPLPVRNSTWWDPGANGTTARVFPRIVPKGC
jgi:hypothetical protein